MNNKKKLCGYIMIIILMISLVGFESGYSQTYGKYGTTSKYIKTTRDTLTLPGFLGEKKTGLITTETASKQLEVFFGKSGATALDSTTYFLIPAGKTLIFETKATKLYRRNASTDSTYSQVYLGNVDLGYNELPTEISGELANNGFVLIDNKEFEKIKESVYRRNNLAVK